MRVQALLATICLSLSAPVLAQDKAVIDKLNESFMQAFNQGEISTAAGMYAEDAYMLPPGTEMIKGRTGIQAFLTAASKELSDLRLTALDVQPLGNDAAREIGALTFKSKTQQPREIKAKYVVVWRNVGGDWKITTDIWNTNE
jgi:uncharacterized protein (TIGR02246 family)